MASAWKHGICDNCCGALSCSLCCNVFCCPFVPIAQMAESPSKLRSKSKCYFIAVALLLVYSVAAVLDTMAGMQINTGFTTLSKRNVISFLGSAPDGTCSMPSGCLCGAAQPYGFIYASKGEKCPHMIISNALLISFGLWILYFIVTLFLVCCSRGNIRHKHALQGSCLGDFCCAFWCQPCVVCQSIEEETDLENGTKYPPCQPLPDNSKMDKSSNVVQFVQPRAAIPGASSSS